MLTQSQTLNVVVESIRKRSNQQVSDHSQAVRDLVGVTGMQPLALMIAADPDVGVPRFQARVELKSLMGHFAGVRPCRKWGCSCIDLQANLGKPRWHFRSLAKPQC